MCFDARTYTQVKDGSYAHRRVTRAAFRLGAKSIGPSDVEEDDVRVRRKGDKPLAPSEMPAASAVARGLHLSLIHI